MHSVMSSVDEMIAVTEVPRAEHHFRVTPMFYQFALAYNAVFVVMGTVFVSMAPLCVVATTLSALFIYSRLYAGYRMRPATVWACLCLSFLTAALNCLTSHYSAVHSANKEHYGNTLVACYILQYLFAVPYLVLSSCVYFRLSKIVPSRPAAAAAPVDVVVGMPAEQPDQQQQQAQQAQQQQADVQVYPVDIPQSGGAVVV